MGVFIGDFDTDLTGESLSSFCWGLFNEFIERCDFNGGSRCGVEQMDEVSNVTSLSFIVWNPAIFQIGNQFWYSSMGTTMKVGDGNSTKTT
jgi:hypothetical protein